MTLLKRFGRKVRTHFERRSFALGELDLKLRPYINFRRGFFIEVGANDGISQSNSLYFEKNMGWTGLLIEAIPTLASKCRKNRPKCIVENCALVSDSYLKETVEMSYCNLMSVVKGGWHNEDAEQKHIQSGLQHLSDGEKVYTVSVPAVQLSKVLDKYNIYHIDLLSLDVEGYESEVLKGIDFDHHRIEFIFVEVRNRDEIESVIGHFYKPIAVLNITEDYSDILYRRK